MLAGAALIAVPRRTATGQAALPRTRLKAARPFLTATAPTAGLAATRPPTLPTSRRLRMPLTHVPGPRTATVALHQIVPSTQPGRLEAVRRPTFGPSIPPPVVRPEIVVTQTSMGAARLGKPVRRPLLAAAPLPPTRTAARQTPTPTRVRTAAGQPVAGELSEPNVTVLPPPSVPLEVPSSAVTPFLLGAVPSPFPTLRDATKRVLPTRQPLRQAPDVREPIAAKEPAVLQARTTVAVQPRPAVVLSVVVAALALLTGPTTPSGLATVVCVLLASASSTARRKEPGPTIDATPAPFPRARLLPPFPPLGATPLAPVATDTPACWPPFDESPDLTEDRSPKKFRVRGWAFQKDRGRNPRGEHG